MGRERRDDETRQRGDNDGEDVARKKDGNYDKKEGRTTTIEKMTTTR